MVINIPLRLGELMRIILKISRCGIGISSITILLHSPFLSKLISLPIFLNTSSVGSAFMDLSPSKIACFYKKNGHNSQPLNPTKNPLTS